MNNKKIGKVTIIVVLFTLLTKLFGFGRDLTLSYFYGSTSISDAYILATTLPITIFSLIYEGVGATFIPACSRLKHKHEKDLLTSNIINLTLLITFLLVAIIEIFPTATIKLFAFGFSGEALNTAVFLVRASMIGVFFSAVIHILSYYLNNNNVFVLPTMRSIPQDVIIIISIILSAYTKSLVPLAFGIPISLLSELLFLIPSVHHIGYKHTFKINLKDKMLKCICIWAIPVIISTAIADLNAIIDRQFASRFVDGGITSLTYADRTINVIRTTFFVPMVTILFPIFSQKASNGERESMRKMSSVVISILIIISIPLSFGTFAFSQDIIRLLFERGAFDRSATINTSLCFQYYAIALIGYALMAIMTKLFHSLTDMKTPMVISIIGVLLNTCLNFILSKIFGLKGLALSTSVSTLFIALAQYICLNRKIHFNNKKILEDFIKSLFASIIMIITIKSIQKYVFFCSNDLFVIILLILFGVLIYIILLRIFKTDGMYDIIKIVKSKRG